MLLQVLAGDPVNRISNRLQSYMQCFFPSRVKHLLFWNVANATSQSLMKALELSVRLVTARNCPLYSILLSCASVEISVMFGFVHSTGGLRPSCFTVSHRLGSVRYQAARI